MKTEKTVSSETVYKGRVLTLKKDEITTPDGKIGIREVVEHGGGAAILAVKDGKALIERQYRYALKKEIYEIPAGKRESGEDFSVTAKRELEEETGYIPLDLAKLTEIYPSPGYTDEKIEIYLATEFQKGSKHFDETEYLTSEWMDLDKIYDMIRIGEITDAKTVVAFLAYEKNL